jgi:alpha-tubulin suppressor-like RCC1 family protein
MGDTIMQRRRAFRPPNCRRLLTGIARALALAPFLAAVACDDVDSPAAPESAAPAPAPLASATSALVFSQVDGGDAHTCGVTADNRAYCWGLGTWGQLGDGTSTSSSAPVAVAGGLRFRQVSAGGVHSCGITTDDKVYCWGFGRGGALGTGTAADSPTPAAVAGGLRFRLVSAGESHTCGVTTPDNAGYCWGESNAGQIGDGAGAGVLRLSPVAVVGNRQWRQISAGQLHTCGVTTFDVAFCWGWDQFGQLGDGAAKIERLSPSRVAGALRFRQVDAGGSHTCAVTVDGRAFCWGNGRSGAVGDGKSLLRFTPRAVAGGLTFDRVTAGQLHSCGEASNNRLYCWGYNIDGQLGDGTMTPRFTPVAVAGGLFFSQASAGGQHTCGRNAQGAAYCWGSYGDGRLGTADITAHLAPAPVVAPM